MANAETAVDELVRQKQEEYDALTSQLAELSEAGQLTPEMRISIESQKSLGAATLRRYEQEEKRWTVQEDRWELQGIQGARQFKINLWLAGAIGVSSAVAPILVWGLEQIFAKP